ncbi:hypothetical protein [Luteimonas arsenica]|uniref:hypothetical protein n=1 Tax=Luteimonas arsenica TaxID=1586242 RepID=UPI00105557F3|nr:hypothetical protein [Luteimonas arsenica]
MSRDPFERLLLAARHRRVALTLALALPWVVALAVTAWRAGGGSTVAAAGVAIMAVVAALAMAWLATRRLDRGWLQRHLDARHPQLEDSSALLAAEPSGLPPLVRLQRERVLQRLPLPDASGVRAPWPRAAIAACATAAAVAVATALLWPAAPSTTPAADERDGAPAGTAAADAIQLVERSLTITPPAYTGLPARSDEALDAKVPEGAKLAWTLRFDPAPDAVALEFIDGRRIELQRDGAQWRASDVAKASGLYRIAVDAALPWRDDALRRIDVVRDRPPSIRVTAPAQNLSLRTPGQRRWALAFEAEDDHGISATAEMHLTMTEGSGENIGFRDEVRHISGKGDRRTKRFAYPLDLDGLGLSEGDDLIVHFVVRDNRAGGAQSTRSASHILRWPPPQAREDSGMDGVLQKVLPAYFSSQRQIIIDAEALIAERSRLQEETFATRSDAIGVDQRLLRLRYGQFLGEESEGAPSLPVARHSDADDLPPPPILLPTNDAEDEAEAWRDMVAVQQHDGHEHVDDDNDDSHGPGRPAGDASTHEAHEHSASDAEEPGRSGFGNAGNVLEEFGHVHDIPEAATLLDPRTRTLLRRALGEMWQSELALRQARPQDALPPANRALALVKEIQQADRIHLARTGSDLPPVDFSRRLGGKREGIASRRAPVAPGELDEDVPAALWRALAAPDSEDIDLAVLQSWLAANDDRSSDPLAVMAAVDAVQRDPGCEACRRRLRALLWPLATPPPAAPRLRPESDAAGRAYLDALRGEAGE